MFLLDVSRDFDLCVKHLLTENTGFLTYMFKVGISKVEALTLSETHQNRPLVLRNLCEQVRIYETRFKGRVNAKERAQIIGACAEMYCKGIIESKRQSLLTDAEKGRILSLDSKRKEMNQLIKEVPDAETENSN